MSETVYERFETNADFQAAVDRLLEQPGRELRIFDPDGAGLRPAARGASTWCSTAPTP
jgi:hypothetical protein